MAWTYTLVLRRAGRSYSSLSLDRGRAALRELIERRVQPLGATAVTLGRTTRHHVERLKHETEKLEQDFERARQSLLEANRALESTKSQLQELYLRREFEYRKAKSDVRIIREINEEENALKEREEREQLRVDECQAKEHDLFNRTRSSHQLLYESTRNYAKRYIVFGLTAGILLTAWKGYNYLTSTEETADDGSASVEILDKLMKHSDSLTARVIDELTTQNSDLKQHLADHLRTSASSKPQDDQSIVKTTEPVQDTENIEINIKLNDTYEQYLAVFLVCLIAGVAGGSVYSLCSLAGQHL